MANVNLTSNQEFKASPFKPQSLIIPCFSVRRLRIFIVWRSFHWERNQNSTKWKSLSTTFGKKVLFIKLFYFSALLSHLSVIQL